MRLRHFSKGLAIGSYALYLCTNMSQEFNFLSSTKNTNHTTGTSHIDRFSIKIHLPAKHELKNLKF